jgi:hypothetical protein
MARHLIDLYNEGKATATPMDTSGNLKRRINAETDTEGRSGIFWYAWFKVAYQNSQRVDPNNVTELSFQVRNNDKSEIWITLWRDREDGSWSTGWDTLLHDTARQRTIAGDVRQRGGVTYIRKSRVIGKNERTPTPTTNPDLASHIKNTLFAQAESLVAARDGDQNPPLPFPVP